MLAGEYNCIITSEPANQRAPALFTSVVCTKCIHIYIYLERERERERGGGGGEREGERESEWVIFVWWSRKRETRSYTDNDYHPITTRCSSIGHFTQWIFLISRIDYIRYTHTFIYTYIFPSGQHDCFVTRIATNVSIFCRLWFCSTHEFVWEV